MYKEPADDKVEANEVFLRCFLTLDIMTKTIRDAISVTTNQKLLTILVATHQNVFHNSSNKVDRQCRQKQQQYIST